MGSAFSLTADNFIKLQDGRKRLTLKYAKRYRVPPNLRIYCCCDGCKYHNSETVYAYHWAAAHCDRETFYFLLKKSSLQEEYDASVNIRTKSQKTPLMYAALHDKPANVRILINDLHCEVNSKDNQGQTALHHAARLGFVDVVKELLKNTDINVNVTDRCDNTPLEEAIHYNMKEVADCLKNRGGASFVDIRESGWRRSYRSYTSTLDSGLQELLRDISSSSNKFDSLCSQEVDEKRSLEVKVAESPMSSGGKTGLVTQQSEDEGREKDGIQVDLLDKDQVLSAGVENTLGKNQEDLEQECNSSDKVDLGGTQNTLDKDQVESGCTLNTQVDLGEKITTLDEDQVNLRDNVDNDKETKDKVKTHQLFDEGVHNTLGSEEVILEGFGEAGSLARDQADKSSSLMEFEKLSLEQEQIVVTAEVHAERHVVSCYDRRLEVSGVTPQRRLTGGSGNERDQRVEMKGYLKSPDQNGVDGRECTASTPTAATDTSQKASAVSGEWQFGSKAKRTSNPPKSERKAILCPA